MPPFRNIISALALASCLTMNAQGIASWMATEHDFGTFSELLKKVSCDIRFVNTGDSAIVITKVQPTCGCTASDFTREPIAPGDTATVSLTYSAVARPGQFQKDVFVYTSGTPRKTVLTIKGNVIASPQTVDELYPFAVGNSLHLDSGIVPLGEIVRGRTKMLYITAYNASTGPLVMNAASHAGHIIARTIPDTVPPGHRATITVFYDSKNAPLWGLNTDSVEVSARPIGSGAPVARNVQIMAVVVDDFDQTGSFRADVPTITTSTDRLNFETIHRDKEKSLSFVIKNTGEQTLHLRRFSAAEKGIKIKCDKKSLRTGKTAKVKVTVSPKDFSNELINTAINILSNDPNNHNMEVRVVGLIQ